MRDFRNDWFFNQHFSKDEILQLWDWVQESGNKVHVVLHDEKWTGFHELDVDKKIDLAGQLTREDCCNWMIRLGFEVIEDDTNN